MISIIIDELTNLKHNNQLGQTIQDYNLIFSDLIKNQITQLKSESKIKELSHLFESIGLFIQQSNHFEPVISDKSIYWSGTLLHCSAIYACATGRKDYACALARINELNIRNYLLTANLSSITTLIYQELLAEIQSVISSEMATTLFNSVYESLTKLGLQDETCFDEMSEVQEPYWTYCTDEILSALNIAFGIQCDQTEILHHRERISKKISWIDFFH